MKHMGMKISKLTLFVSIAVIAASSYSCGKSEVGGASFAVDGAANGAQVVPVSASSATGSISAYYNGGDNQLKGVIKWSGLSGSPTAIHIHAGAVGRNGYPYFLMVNVPTGTTDSLNFTSAFTQAQETITYGNYYFDIHTAAYPNGEIRGQLVAH